MLGLFTERGHWGLRPFFELSLFLHVHLAWSDVVIEILISLEVLTLFPFGSPSHPRPFCFLLEHIISQPIFLDQGHEFADPPPAQHFVLSLFQYVIWIFITHYLNFLK